MSITSQHGANSLSYEISDRNDQILLTRSEFTKLESLKREFANAES